MRDTVQQTLSGHHHVYCQACQWQPLLRAHALSTPASASAAPFHSMSLIPLQHIRTTDHAHRRWGGRSVLSLSVV
jgi:hypothetical protein